MTAMVSTNPWSIYSDLRQHRHTLEEIEKRLLNVKKSAISEFISRSKSNETL